MILLVEIFSLYIYLQLVGCLSQYAYVFDNFGLSWTNFRLSMTNFNARVSVSAFNTE